MGVRTALTTILGRKNQNLKSLVVVCMSKKRRFCRSKHNFVQTKVTKDVFLSRQKTCFVATNTSLRRQTCICGDKTLIATKNILVAASASDRNGSLETKNNLPKQPVRQKKWSWEPWRWILWCTCRPGSNTPSNDLSRSLIKTFNFYRK